MIGGTFKIFHPINENEVRELEYHHFATPIALMDPGIEQQWLTLDTSENQICASWWKIMPPNGQNLNFFKPQSPAANLQGTAYDGGTCLPAPWVHSQQTPDGGDTHSSNGPDSLMNKWEDNEKDEGWGGGID